MFFIFYHQHQSYKPSSGSLMWLLQQASTVSNIFLYKSAVCPTPYPGLCSLSPKQSVSICPFPFTLCCSRMLRRDGWQLFVDSMPRLISSVCLFWCQHSAGSVGESACLCFKAYSWHQDTDTTKQLVFFWHDWPIWVDHQLLNDCTYLKDFLLSELLFFFLSACSKSLLVDKIGMNSAKRIFWMKWTKTNKTLTALWG